MTAYTSMKSYALAVKLRSARTILVEGASDKAVVKRLVLAYQETSKLHRAYVVDEASLITDEENLKGKGNREKILSLAPILSSVSEKINWLVDREWDGFDNNDSGVESPACFNNDWGYFTKGHSIENYWFSPMVVSGYLKMAHGSSLPVEYFIELDTRFEAILRLANAYSLTAKDNFLIKRCTGLVTSNFIVWNEGRYAVSSALNEALLLRGVAIDFVNEVVLELEKPTFHRLPNSALRWLCHGHLGEEIIWCCAANLARGYTSDQQIIEAIERGFRNEKQAHHADMLARQPIEHLEPLDGLIKWSQCSENPLSLNETTGISV